MNKKYWNKGAFMIDLNQMIVADEQNLDRIEDPVIRVNGDRATVTFTSVLNANAYGARGTYRMQDTHHYEMRGGEWIAVNG